jgi:hypothetical protein
MSKEIKEQLIKRLKSFAWRAGAWIVVAGLAAIPDMLGIMKIDANIIALIALITGEITKFVNTFVMDK